MSRILGIETSCDETAAAVVADGHEVLANVVASQAGEHALYGGVVPELAAREHLRAIQPVAEAAMRQADLEFGQLDAVAVTHGPGLLTSLLVGVSYAKGLAAALDRPLLGVNHLLAHVFGAFIEERDCLDRADSYPILALIVSGGHTLLLEIVRGGACRVLGQTLDDAAGEAFDKAAKVLDLGYPGGPIIDKLAAQGDPAAYHFPRGLTGERGVAVKPANRFNFSFSGVKTSMLYHLLRLAGKEPGDDAAGVAGELARDLPEKVMMDTIASYQEAIVDVLVRKTMAAAVDSGARTLALCGGVACNSRLRDRLRTAAEEAGTPLIIAPPRYCTDNAVMTAGLAHYQLEADQVSPLDLDAMPRPPLPTAIPFALKRS